MPAPSANNDATVSSKSTGGDGGNEAEGGEDDAVGVIGLRVSKADVRAMDMGEEAG